MPTTLVAFIVFLVGAALWTLAEYLLHRFAMHELNGRGIMSREHLEHHVRSTWQYSSILLLSWVGVVVVSVALWLPLGWILGGPVVGAPLAAGWVGGYALYEYIHAMAHLRAPGGRHGAFLRRHHFHHHFGHPMANHGVTTSFWDRVFGTYEQPEVVRVPRRLALTWMVDDQGGLLPRFEGQYVLVGADRADERTAALDRARAFASIAPVD